MIDEMVVEDVRITRHDGVERLRRDRIEQRVDRIGVSGLKAGVGLKPVPDEVVPVNVLVDAKGEDLFVIRAR